MITQQTGIMHTIPVMVVHTLKTSVARVART